MSKLDELDIFALMKRLEKVEGADISERLNYIEKHLKHFVYAATEMKDKFANGIKISIDQSSVNVAASINQQLKDSVILLRSEVVEIRQLRQEIKEERKALQEQLKNDSVTGALKYMAKQLTELTQYVHEIKEEGIKKQIRLDLTMDGYEMVQKKPSHSTVDKIQKKPFSPYSAEKKLLDTLTDRESKVLIHRHGLFGEKSKTYKAIGQVFNVSGERIGQIYQKALRKCRQPVRKELADDLTHLELRTAILGE